MGRGAEKSQAATARDVVTEPSTVPNKAAAATAPHEKIPEIPWFIAFTTYFAYAMLIFLGRMRDLIGWMWGDLGMPSKPPKTMAPLLFKEENFYTRRLYYRIQQAFNHPVRGPPGARIDVLDRERKPGKVALSLKEPMTSRKCLNLGSYNYLGFADDWESTCGPDVRKALAEWPVGVSSSRMDLGTTKLIVELEQLVAEFLGKEDALVYNMGFATNSTTIPCLAGKGDLLVSDALNHTSIVNGARSSAAHVRVFKHNDVADLEKTLREAIAMGQPRTRRPWNKIIVAVEGIYSMEGVICNLKEITEVCKKHKCYIYLDEAHSIGALGPTGRGVTEHCGVDTKDIAIMMGTFTKSFGGMGGYIAADKATIDYLRISCTGSVYHNSMSPIVCKQIITALRTIMGRQNGNLGMNKLNALRDNSNFFRAECEKMGLHTYGTYDSPIIPVLLYNPTKIIAFQEECFKRGIASVVVGFPATPLVLSRARFCISAAHTKDDLVRAIADIKEIADLLQLKYKFSWFG